MHFQMSSQMFEPIRRLLVGVNSPRIHSPKLLRLASAARLCSRAMCRPDLLAQEEHAAAYYSKRLL